VEYYTLNLYGLTRKLPLVHASRQTKLANFSLLGDIELVDVLADAYTQKLNALSFDYLVAGGVKVVPLVHGIAKRLGHKRFVVCRKRVKPYMVDPVIFRPPSNFPKHVHPLIINGTDVTFLKNKKVVVIDDVVSTGMTMHLLHMLMKHIGALVVASAAVLRQGEQFTTLKDFIYVGEIPIVKVEPHLAT
jgi:adenine phosphoribosyltransferase